MKAHIKRFASRTWCGREVGFEDRAGRLVNGGIGRYVWLPSRRPALLTYTWDSPDLCARCRQAKAAEDERNVRRRARALAQDAI